MNVMGEEDGLLREIAVEGRGTFYSNGRDVEEGGRDGGSE